MTSNAKSGRLFLLRDGSGGSAPVIAALRSTSFTISGDSVDVTDKDSPSQFRELLSGAGVVSVSISASGLLHGNSQTHTLITRTLNRSGNVYRLEFDNGDVLEGSFQIVNFEASGQYDKEQTYNISLESAGAITFTAAA